MPEPTVSPPNGLPADWAGLLARWAPLALPGLVEALRDDQARRWRAGERLLAEAYLGAFPALAASAEDALVLVCGEALLRLELGESPALGEYQARFPHHAEALAVQFELQPHLDGPPGVTTPALPRPAGAGGPLPEVPGYEVLGELGSGGMGWVLRARDPDLNRTLAVKVLREEHGGEPELARRFRAEAQVTGQLQHPGIPPVHAVGTLPDGRPFFAMKLVAGRTLAELLQERQDVSVGLPHFLEVFGQVCQAVAYAHSRGVIHRDLKPLNVMVGAFGEVQVMDWGLAKVLPADRQAGPAPAAGPPGPGSAVRTLRTEGGGLSSQQGAVLGTFAYMPPEQALGQVEALDERADVFGLGAILCEVLTGKPPYAVAGWEAHLVAAAGDLAGAWARLDGCGADAELVRLARACLAPRREDRPRDAQAVAAAVAAYQASVQERLRAAELERAQAEARAAEERKRRRLALALAAAVLALAGVGGGGYAWVAQQRAERRAAAAGVIEEALTRAAEQRGRAAAAAEGDLSGWVEAESEAKRAENLLDQGEAEPALRARVAAVRDELKRGRAEAGRRAEHAAAERRLVARLEAIRGERGEDFDARRADRAYAEAFAAFGLDLEAVEPRAAGARLAGRAATAEIAAALDEWCRLRRVNLARSKGVRPWQRLAEVARAADPDPWRNGLRSVAGRPGAEVLAALRKQAGDIAALERQPAASLVLLADMLREAGEGERSAEVLRVAWRRFPGDFWVNGALGGSSWSGGHHERPEEAVRFLTAAVAARPGSAGAHSNLGVALKDKGQLEEAIAAYRQAIRLDPKLPSAHTNLGIALKAKGQLDEAIAAYRQAIRLDPKLPSAHTNLGNALEAKGQLDEAVAAHRQAIRLDPKDATAHNNLGAALGAKGQLDEAIAACRQAIRLDPKDARAHYNLGAALAAKGQLDEAVAAYRQAIRLDPKSARAHNNFGVALGAKGQLDEAIAASRQAIRLDPKEARAHTGLGAALGAKGRLDEAVAAHRQAIRLDPKDATAHNNLGAALGAKGQLDEAIAACRQAIRLDPKEARAHYNLGAALEAKGQLDEAVAAYRQAIRLDPKSARAHNNLGVALEAKGQLDEAIAASRQAIRLDPKLPPAHTNLGIALAAKGQLDEAVAAHRQAIRLDPKDATAHNNLGAALGAKGQLDEAIAACRQAIRLDPKYAQAHGALGQALLQQGKFAEARAATQRCLDLLPPHHPLRKFVTQQLQQCQQSLELEERLPALLQGKAKPADAAEWLALAQLCHRYKQLYAASARFYAEAFADQPRLAEDLRAGHRYDGACAAALAAGAQGKDAAKPDDQERARLRRQALAWLRADLAAWDTLAQKSAPQARQQVRGTLTRWRQDADLGGLRDKAELVKLPEAERQACRDLWAEVDAVLKRVGQTR